MKRYICMICGYVYDEAEGCPDQGIAPGTRWEDVPDDFTCPDCGVGKEAFFWTSTERIDYRNDSERALYFFLHGLQNGDFQTSDWGEFTKRAALSVRCVK